ncbi:hypothetical protein NHX12_010953 [Muraenolepis orangiensis]|uniref:Nucleophosmin C-terminal domain-containing protein n=1 Tax=Muraenolepis orangiensis TaxID=630683 RepID=A0A9Q0DEX3_9TELE|nr:hypothetical protein NHX12_010953 [Muraenolepis orangiensis]
MTTPSTNCHSNREDDDEDSDEEDVKAQKAPKKSPQSSVNKTKGSSNQSVSSGKPGSVLFKAQSKDPEWVWTRSGPGPGVGLDPEWAGTRTGPGPGVGLDPEHGSGALVVDTVLGPGALVVDTVLGPGALVPLKAAPPGPSKPPPLAEIKSKLAAAVKEGKPMPKTEQKFENFAKSSFKLSDAKVVKDLWSFIQTLKGKK